MEYGRLAKCTLALLILAVGGLTGCRREAANPTAADLSTGGEGRAARQREVALAAQKDLFEQLSGRLLAVLSDGGPVEAIEVCSREAQEIGGRVGVQHHVQIGRTSFRLRNEHNVPPAWAAEWVAQRVVEPQFVNLPDGQLGALLPIRLKPTCLICHGPQEQIASDVRQVLAARYPRDQATGFELDSLRGWFWVEVPRL